MKKEHKCDNLDFANGYNLELLITINHYDPDIDWHLNIEKNDDGFDYFYKTIEGIKYCPFCGKKLT